MADSIEPRASRATRQVMAGGRRATVVAARLGTALRDARLASGLRQIDLAKAAGISQARVSELERGLGASASLETWARAGAAVGEQLVGFLELAPGATPPRDIEHLRRQAALIDLARPGGWQALPELALDAGAPRSRSADVALVRWDRREAILAEIWNWFDDVGASLRSLDGKREALVVRLLRDEPHGREWRVRCLFVVRRTRRNERLVADLRPLFRARFPGSSRDWLHALSGGGSVLPGEDGLLWSNRALAMEASRLGPG